MKFYKKYMGRRFPVVMTGFLLAVAVISTCSGCGMDADAAVADAPVVESTQNPETTTPAVESTQNPETTDYETPEPDTMPTEAPAGTDITESDMDVKLATNPDASDVKVDTVAKSQETTGTDESKPQASATPEPANKSNASPADIISQIVSQPPASGTPAPADKEPVGGSTSGTETGSHVRVDAIKGEGDGLPYAEITSDTVIDTGTERVYGFRNEAWAGCGLDGTVLPFELYYGFHASTKDGVLTYSAYSHLDGVEPTGRIIVIRNSSRKSQKLPAVSTTKEVSVDLSNQANDSFGIVAEFSNGTTCYLTVYINDGKAYLVNDTQASVKTVTEKYLTKADTIRELAESHNVTPEKSLAVDTKSIAYPSADKPEYGWRCDTDLWRKLAHEIVTDETLADSVKVIMLHDWMTANLSYDYYVSQKLDMSRDYYHKDWSGTYSVYSTHAGVCRDFVQIFAIMCREMGIPCSSLDSTELNHTWSIVYLDGEWREIDFTKDIKRAVYGEDVTDIRNADKTVSYKTFLTPAPIKSFNKVDVVGDNIICESFRLTGECKDCIHTN